METIATALTAAETGHLVFATLHTQDAPQTVDRIIDVFPPEQQGQVRAQLSIGLQGIVTQTLIPTADGNGRCVAAEVLVPTPGVRNLIREGKTHQIYSLIQTGAPHGMQTMDASLAGLVNAGHITMAMAETRSGQPAELRRLIQNAENLPPARRPPDGRRTAVRVQGRRRRGAAQDGIISGVSESAVMLELKNKGLQVMRLDEKKSGIKMEISLLPKRVKPAELTIMTRQLATMVSSGMTLLRAFYVLEDQVENPKLKDTLSRRPRGHRGGADVLRRAREAPQGLRPALRRHGPRGRGRWRARGVARTDCRPAREGRLAAAPGQERDDVPGGRAELCDGGPDRADRLHRPRVRGRLQGLRRRAAADHEVHGEPLARGHRLVVPPARRRDRHRRRLQEVEEVGVGPPTVGQVPPPDSVQDRPDGPEDRARALVADLLGALFGGRADHAGDRGDRDDRRQHGRRAGDGRRRRLREVRRLDLRLRCAKPRSSPAWSRR